MKAVVGFAIIATVLTAQPSPPKPTASTLGGRLVVGAGHTHVRPPARMAPRPDPHTRTHRTARQRRQPVEPVAVGPSRIGHPWGALAECESNGNWQESSGTIFEGGLQFHPQTWSAYKPPGFPPRAYMASPAQQIQVAELVLADQGWGAWPSCARKLGLR